MTGKLSRTVYVPGTYATRRPGNMELVDLYVKAWESREMAMKATGTQSTAQPEISPCICFSRKIGVGALEIADLVGQQLGTKVTDREVIEQIANQTAISQKAVAYFDERFPGYFNRTFKYLFGEKAFIDSDYSRHLFSTVHAMANLAPTIFVGRGTHLILPRDRIMAVRCIFSDKRRRRRIAGITGMEYDEARRQLSDMDKAQAAFFKKVFGKKDAHPSEFDMVLNLDHFGSPSDVADIIVYAFRKKFGDAVAKTLDRTAA